MMQSANKRKPATKRRGAAAQAKTTRARKSGGAAKTTRTPKTKGVRQDGAEAALATLLALLHADRWLFEAAELAKKGHLDAEIEEYNRIRAEIVVSLNRLQPRAYGAMTRRGYMGIGGF